MYKTYQSARKASLVPPDFGEDIRNEEFVLDPAYAFFNHASRGTTPKKVLDEEHSKTLEMEANQDMYWGVDRRDVIDAATQTLATFLSCDVNELSFVENTTRGLNNTMKTIDFSAGQAILQNNWTYGAVKNMHEIIARDKGVEILEIVHELPITSTDQIVQQYRDMFAAHSNIRVAVVDHISSVPAVLFPVREIIDVCHEHNALCLIDGAHASGQISLNLADLGADFYVANTNKWTFGAKSCAYQWVSPTLHNMTEPVVTSFSHLDGFPENMDIQGTRNDAPYLAFPEAFDFYNWIGGLSAITAYVQPLMEEGVALLLEAWQTERYPVPVEMEPPFMRMVTIPDTLAYPKSSEGADRLKDDLRDRFQIMTSISYHNGEIMQRISIHVYCAITDFERLRDAVMVLKDEEPDNPRQVASKAKKHLPDVSM